MSDLFSKYAEENGIEYADLAKKCLEMADNGKTPAGVRYNIYKDAMEKLERKADSEGQQRQLDDAPRMLLQKSREVKADYTHLKDKAVNDDKAMDEAGNEK